MRRIRPWVKKALLVTIIIVAAGAGLSVISGEHGRDFSQVVSVKQEVHNRPGDMRISIKDGGTLAVPAPGDMPALPALRGGDGPVKVQRGEGGMRMELPHREHGVSPGVVVAGIILIAGLLLLFFRRGKKSRSVEGANVLAGIPSASDFLDQWELQQNQTKESK